MRPSDFCLLYQFKLSTNFQRRWFNCALRFSRSIYLDARANLAILILSFRENIKLSLSFPQKQREDVDGIQAKEI